MDFLEDMRLFRKANDNKCLQISYRWRQYKKQHFTLSLHWCDTKKLQISKRTQTPQAGKKKKKKGKPDA